MANIPEQWRDRYQNCLDDWAEKGWIHKDLNIEGIYHCHTMIQNVLRKKLNTNAKNCELIIQFLINKIHDLFTKNPLQAAEWLPYADSILQKLPDETHNIATLANNVALTYQTMGNHPKSLAYNLKAMAIVEKILPPEHTDLAASYNNMATAYAYLSDWEQAFSFAQKAFQIYLKKLPIEHPDIQIMIDNLGDILEEATKAKGKKWAEPYQKWFDENCKAYLK